MALENKREPTTLAVHRCRFVDYAPSAITALAYPPLPLPSVKGKKKTGKGKQPLRFGTLAVGHANGNIDLCEWMGTEHDVQCPQAWVTQKTLPGPYPSKVDAVAFAIRYPDDFDENDVPRCSDLRLFSSGGGSELLEWDIERSCIRRTIGSQGGSIWSIAANPSSNSLALGCEDGTVRLLSIANDTLTHLRRFDRVKCRMLSIAWGPPVPRRQKTDVNEGSSDDDEGDDEENWSDSWLVTGGSDSSLRKWDVTTGRVINRMGTDKIRGERTLVWTVGVLGDGTIISGDSLGMVKFWDSRTCTQLQSFNAHGADVLCIAISPEGKAIYTSGVDQKTIQFSIINTSSEKGSSSSSTRWAQTSSRRLHSHDVRALAIWPPYTPLPHSFQRHFPKDVAPILASGGLDMSVVVTPAALPTSTIVKITNPLVTSTESTFEDAYHRRLAYSVGGVMKVARQARLITCARDAGLTVWRIQKKPDGAGTEEEAALEDIEAVSFEGGWEKVLEMEFNVNSNLVAHQISDDGKWLVISDVYETKLFVLDQDAKGQVKPKRIKDFSSTLQAHIPASSTNIPTTGGLAFQFTPDSSKLVISTAVPSYILVVDLMGAKPHVLRRFDHHLVKDFIFRDRVVVGRSKNAINGDVDMADAEENEEIESEKEEDSEGAEETSRSTPSAIVGVHRIAISTDGQWLATSDNYARTHIFNLDSISHHCILPSFQRPVQALAFDPMHPSVLLLALPDNSIQFYDVEARQFPVWGKELSNSLPRRFTSAHDPVIGVSFDPAVSDTEAGKTKYIIFWGATWIFKVSLDTTVRFGGRKRRRDVVDEDRPWRDFKMITQYRPILCVDFLTKGELVVVERPLVDVLSTLPPAYFKHKYGIS